jgi:hypothetical protein
VAWCVRPPPLEFRSIRLPRSLVLYLFPCPTGTVSGVHSFRVLDHSSSRVYLPLGTVALRTPLITTRRLISFYQFDQGFFAVEAIAVLRQERHCPIQAMMVSLRGRAKKNLFYQKKRHCPIAGVLVTRPAKIILPAKSMHVLKRSFSHGLCCLIVR